MKSVIFSTLGALAVAEEDCLADENVLLQVKNKVGHVNFDAGHPLDATYGTDFDATYGTDFDASYPLVGDDDHHMTFDDNYHFDDSYHFDDTTGYESFDDNYHFDDASHHFDDNYHFDDASTGYESFDDNYHFDDASTGYESFDDNYHFDDTTGYESFDDNYHFDDNMEYGAEDHIEEWTCMTEYSEETWCQAEESCKHHLPPHDFDWSLGVNWDWKPFDECTAPFWEAYSCMDDYPEELWCKAETECKEHMPANDCDWEANECDWTAFDTCTAPFWEQEQQEWDETHPADPVDEYTCMTEFADEIWCQAEESCKHHLPPHDFDWSLGEWDWKIYEECTAPFWENYSCMDDYPEETWCKAETECKEHMPAKDCDWEANECDWGAYDTCTAPFWEHEQFIQRGKRGGNSGRTRTRQIAIQRSKRAGNGGRKAGRVSV